MKNTSAARASLPLGGIIAAVVLVAAVVLDDLFRCFFWFRGQPKDERRTAEMLRREIFDQMLNALPQPAPAPAGPGAISPWLLALEYFRRFQLYAQIDYYDDAIKRQSTRAGFAGWARRLASAAFWLMFVVCVLIAVAAAAEQGWFSGMPEFTAKLHLLESKSYDTWLIAAALIASVLYVYFAIAAIDDHRSLYQMALSDLATIAATRLEPARIAAAKGDDGPVRDLVADVHAAMRREHTVWLGR
mgnify:CR=1 FL=1